MGHRTNSSQAIVGHRAGWMLLLSGLLLLVSPCTWATSMTDCETIIHQGNEPVAYKHCLAAAKEGNPKAQVIVGMALMSGVGVFKDPDAAVGWFKLAANQKYPAAIYQLGLAKIAGMGIGQDESGGIALIQRAAEAGDPAAKDFLAQVGAAPKIAPEPVTRKRQRYECTGVGCGKPIDGQPR